MPEKRDQIIRDLTTVINRHSLENGSNTPDFILAEHMLEALDSFAQTSRARERWYGKILEIKYEPDEVPGILETGVITPNEVRKMWGWKQLDD